MATLEERRLEQQRKATAAYGDAIGSATVFGDVGDVVNDVAKRAHPISVAANQGVAAIKSAVPAIIQPLQRNYAIAHGQTPPVIAPTSPAPAPVSPYTKLAATMGIDGFGMFGAPTAINRKTATKTTSAAPAAQAPAAIAPSIAQPNSGIPFTQLPDMAYKSDGPVPPTARDAVQPAIGMRGMANLEAAPRDGVIRTRVGEGGIPEFYGRGKERTPAEERANEIRRLSEAASWGNGPQSRAAAVQLQQLLGADTAISAAERGANPAYDSTAVKATAGLQGAQAGAQTAQGELARSQAADMAAGTPAKKAQSDALADHINKLLGPDSEKYRTSDSGRTAAQLLNPTPAMSMADIAPVLSKVAEFPSESNLRLGAMLWAKVANPTASPEQQQALAPFYLKMLSGVDLAPENKADGGVVGYAQGGAVMQPAYAELPPENPLVDKYRNYSILAQQMGITPVAYDQFSSMAQSAAMQRPPVPQDPSAMGMPGYAWGGMVDDDPDPFGAIGGGRGGRAQAASDANLAGKAAEWGAATGFDDLSSTEQWNMTTGLDRGKPAGGRALRNWQATQASMFDDAIGAQRAINTADAQDNKEWAAFRKDGVEGARRAAGWPGYEEEVVEKKAAGGAIGAIDVSGRLLAGPGTGKSDSIPAVVDGNRPAALSTGEYVMPVEVVKFFGTDKLDKMRDRAVKAINGAE